MKARPALRPPRSRRRDPENDGHARAQECPWDKALAPQVKREAIRRMVDEHQLSERRACRVVGLSSDCYRHPPALYATTQALSKRIVELAHERRRIGCRRIHVKVGFGQRPFKLGVFSLQLAQPLGIGGVHPAQLGAPLVERGVAEPACAAELLDRDARLGLPDDLFLRESALHDLLRVEFTSVNHKRVYRLYRNANLAVLRRRKGERPVNERVPLQLARKVNEVWSMDCVSDSLANGRRRKYLTVADEFSQECVGIAVDFGISGCWSRLRAFGATHWLCGLTTVRTS